MLRTLSLLLTLLAATPAHAGDPNTSDADLQARLQISAADVVAAEQLGGRFMARSQPAKAARVYAAALTAVPGWAQGHFLLARAYEAAGNLPYAEVAYSNHLRLAPGQPQTVFALASVLDRQGKSEAAVIGYEQFLTAMPLAPANDPQATHARRRILALRGTPAPLAAPPPPALPPAPPPVARPPAPPVPPHTAVPVPRADRRPATPLRVPPIEATGLPTPKGARPGGFFLLHRVVRESVAGADLSLFTFEEDVREDSSILQFESYVAVPISGSFTAFATWPMSWFRRDRDDDGVGARGDVDLGMAWIHSGDMFELAVRGGLGLPVASSSDDELRANAFATSVRPRQMTLVDNDVSYVRLSATPLIRVDLIFVGLELALSIPGIDDATGDRKTDTIRHVGLVLGANLDALRLMVESSSSKLPMVRSDDDRDVGATAVSARWTRGRVRPGVAWVVPTDFIDDAVDSIFVFSVQVVTGPLD